MAPLSLEGIDDQGHNGVQQHDAKDDEIASIRPAQISVGVSLNNKLLGENPKGQKRLVVSQNPILTETAPAFRDERFFFLALGEVINCSGPSS